MLPKSSERRSKLNSVLSMQNFRSLEESSRHGEDGRKKMKVLSESFKVKLNLQTVKNVAFDDKKSNETPAANVIETKLKKKLKSI